MNLFYSYSSFDESLRMELEEHLSLLKRDGLLKTSSFRNINAGSEWEREIDHRLASADIALLLVSASFIASRYCWEIELRQAMERANRGEMLLVPVVLRPCDWQTAPFARFQVLPDGAKPVTSWRPRDKAWANVAAALRRLISSSIQAPSSAAVIGHFASDAGQQLTDAQETGQGSGPAQRARIRATRQITEARINLLNELPCLYKTLAELAHVQHEIPTKIITEGERCEISTGHVRVIVAPSTNGRTLVVDLSYFWYSVDILELLPAGLYGYLSYARARWVRSSREKKWQRDVEQAWGRELTDSDAWVWVNRTAGMTVSTDELASLLMAQLIEHYANEPTPPANSA